MCVCLCCFWPCNPSVLLPAYMHVYFFLFVFYQSHVSTFVWVNLHTHCVMLLYMNRLSRLMVHNNLWKAVFQTNAHRTVVWVRPTTKLVISVNISRQTRPSSSYHNLLFQFLLANLEFTCQMTFVSASAIIPEVKEKSSSCFGFAAHSRPGLTLRNYI